MEALTSRPAASRKLMPRNARDLRTGRRPRAPRPVSIKVNRRGRAPAVRHCRGDRQLSIRTFAARCLQRSTSNATLTRPYAARAAARYNAGALYQTIVHRPFAPVAPSHRKHLVLSIHGSELVSGGQGAGRTVAVRSDRPFRLGRLKGATGGRDEGPSRRHCTITPRGCLCGVGTHLPTALRQQQRITPRDAERRRDPQGRRSSKLGGTPCRRWGADLTPYRDRAGPHPRAGAGDDQLEFLHKSTNGRM